MLACPQCGPRDSGRQPASAVAAPPSRWPSPHRSGSLHAARAPGRPAWEVTQIARSCSVRGPLWRHQNTHSLMRDAGKDLMYVKHLGRRCPTVVMAEERQ